jgi:hypothetical protein
MMRPRHQAGLSLLGCALLMALLAYGAMAVIFALHYQRNLLAESWTLLAGKVPAAFSVPHAILQGPPAAIRKCSIAGQTVYSNTDCRDDNRSTQEIALPATEGVEAPKAPVSVAPVDQPAPSATDRAIDKATGALAH